MMQAPWKLFRLFLCITFLLEETVVAVKVDQACYGNRNSQSCSQHRLQCQQGSSIFFTQAVRGFKRTYPKCYVQRPYCDYIDECCRNHDGQDCLKVYTPEAFSDLAVECWNTQTCNYTVRSARTYSCGPIYEDGSGYSTLRYLCLQNNAVLDFSDSSPKTGSSLVLRYTKSDDAGSYICLVEAEDCSSRSVDVLMYRTKTASEREYCTSLGGSDNKWLVCSSSSGLYYPTQRSTPFGVRLYVNKDNDAAEAWVLIHGNDARTLRVTCKSLFGDVPFPECSPVTTLKTTSKTTTSPTEGQTAGSSASPDTTSAAGAQSSSTSSPANVSSPDGSGDTSAQSSENSSNTAGIVGGVVGALLLLAVVVAVVVFFLKRRSPTAKPFPRVVAWFKGGNSSRSHGNSGRAEAHVAYAQPTSLPVYDNSAAAITDEAGVRVNPESDYNHLGQKPTSSASRDVTYGHLAVGNDITDYGYDHVAKDKPATRSGDVINNVYDTAGPATGGSSDEDFYNTTGAAKNRPGVINNIYNTPSPATEASPDVEYCNAAGVPQTGPDVINSDYDIPKSARTPGPGETEAHDVTGDDAGSPYELARNVK